MLDLDSLKEKIIYNIKNYNIDYEDAEEIENNDYHKNKIRENFSLPIEYLSNKKKVKQSIISDLELHSKNNLYNYVFNPTTSISKLTTSFWNEYYTCDTDFLNDTIKLLKNYKYIPNNIFETNNEKNADNISYSTIKNKNIVDNIFNKWTEIKDDTGFADKYGYISWKHISWLNKSSLFLEISSMYNFLSPLLSLIVPIIILLIPFFILKFKGIKLSIKEYIKTLETIGKNNILLKFVDFNKQTIDKKLYIVGTVLFYLFQMYQNVLICLRFYLNLTAIHEFLFTLKDYLRKSIKELSNFTQYTKNLSTYNNFSLDVNNHKQVLSNIYDKLTSISPYKLSITKTFQIGYVLKVFYEIYNNEVLTNSLYFMFGFNGYLENLTNLQLNIENKYMNNCIFTEKKTLIKESYYPTLIRSDPVKNKISMKKNIIITGPNAAGKTTILKTTLFNVILSQQIGCGFYSDAKICPYDYIHCYLNIPDTSGRDSLFQAEARRCKNILDEIINTNSDERHFCIFDELFSGTNPYEAIASAYSYLDFLSKHKNVNFMLTTHFITLCNRLEKHEGILNCSMKTKQTNNNIIYKYKLGKGISKIKGGITVLQNLDYPLEIIESTKQIIKTLN